MTQEIISRHEAIVEHLHLISRNKRDEIVETLDVPEGTPIALISMKSAKNEIETAFELSCSNELALEIGKQTSPTKMHGTADFVIQGTIVDSKRGKLEIRADCRSGRERFDFPTNTFLFSSTNCQVVPVPRA